MIKLGVYGKDKVTGFEGVVQGRLQWLTGCAQYSLQPRGMDKDGKPLEAQWFDEGKIQIIDNDEGIDPEDLRIKEKKEDKPGGPTPSGVPTGGRKP